MGILSIILVINVSISYSTDSHSVTDNVVPSCGQELASWSWKLRVIRGGGAAGGKGLCCSLAAAGGFHTISHGDRGQLILRTV